MLKSVPQYHKLGKTEVLYRFYVPHVVLRGATRQGLIASAES